MNNEEIMHVASLKEEFKAERERLEEELRITKEDNKILKEQVRYWKWQAVSWGAPDYENFEFERT